MVAWLTRLALVVLLPTVDAHGDPLPPGARTRLGTVRWRHGGSVTALAYTADGRGLLSLSDDGAVRCWEVPSGRLRWMRYDPAEWLTTLAVAPAVGLAAVGNSKGTIRILTAETGREVHHWQGHRWWVSALAFSPDGRFLGSGADDDAAVWDTAAWQEVRRFPHRDTVRALAFQTRGSLLATGEEQRIRLWDCASGTEAKSLPGHAAAAGDKVEALLFTPDGRKLISAGSTDRLVRIWDVGQAKEVQQLPLESDSSKALAFAPDGQTLAGASYPFLCFYKPQTGAFQGKPLELGAKVLAFSPDGRTLALSGGRNHAVTFVDVAARRALTPPADQPTGPQWGVAFAPSGTEVATVGRGKYPLLWEAATGRLQPRTWTSAGGGQPVTGNRLVAYGAEETRLITWDSLSIIAWDLAASRFDKTAIRNPQLPRETVLAMRETCRPLALTKDRKSAVVLHEEGNKTYLRMVDLASSVVLWQTRLPSDGIYHTVATAGDGRAAAVGTLVDGPANRPGEILLCAPGRDKPRHRFAAHHGTVHALAFSPDGLILASVGADGALKLWDVATGTERRTPRGTRQELFTVAFAPDGATVAAAGTDAVVRLWESATGQLRAEYRGHAGPVHHLAFSPDGMTLASASAETTVLLWGLYGAAGPERFAAVDLEQNWAALAGDDAAAAFRAVGRFVRQGDRAVAFLATKLAPAAVDAEAVARWVADLGSPTAARREAATAVLARVGSPAAAALRRVVAKADAPAEQRRRAEELLGQWDSSPPAAERQTLRAVEVLAHVGTAAARAELARLGQGAEGAAVTVAARAALARLVPPSR